MMDFMTWVPVAGIHIRPWVIVMIVVIVALVAALVALGIYGKKLQDKQAQTQEEMQKASQTVSMLVVDKKRMKLKESGLPQIVIDQTPKRFRGQKVPIVKAKVGPRIMSMICDEKIFDQVPVKKEIRAIVSGIYIMGIKGVRGNLENAPKRKPTFRERLQNKIDSMNNKAK